MYVHVRSSIDLGADITWYSVRYVSALGVWSRLGISSSVRPSRDVDDDDEQVSASKPF